MLFRSIRVWSAKTGDVIFVLKGHSSGVNSIAFSPDGSRIVSGSGDRTVRVWEVTSGQLVFDPFVGHTGWIWSVTFSHDGRYVASGSDDKTIKIWNVEDRHSASGDSTNGENNVNWKWNAVYGMLDGWVVGRQKELLLWVPPDMRDSLSCSRRNIAILGRSFMTKVDFCNAAIGPRWRGCFNPPVS